MALMRERIASREGEIVQVEIQKLLSSLGAGTVSGVAYDTAWTARLAPHYPNHGFERSLEWLRRHQHPDGSWGAPLVHYHDRFISTLAAIIALRECGNDSRDERRVQHGEKALWRLVGRLGHDDSDTVGFPLLSVALAEEATALGLDVPLPPTRYTAKYRNKIQYLLEQPQRDWRATTLTFSLEGLRYAIRDGDRVLEDNHSVAVSPSATAAYLLAQADDSVLGFMKKVLEIDATGAAPAVGPMDIFEYAWSLSYLKSVGAIEPDYPEVRAALDRLWGVWSSESGVGYSSHYSVPDLDCTVATFTVLQWGGYDVSADVFNRFEKDDHFSTYTNETNPSHSVHVRLLSALRLCEDHPRYPEWIAKVLRLLTNTDANGSFWWDKWHASPYYVNSLAVDVMRGLADDLVASRARWILRTQNDDGGWGYLGASTAEETAYCLQALLLVDRTGDRIESQNLDAAARYLYQQLDCENAPLYISKTLYTPYKTVRSAILSALFAYETRNEK